MRYARISVLLMLIGILGAAVYAYDFGSRAKPTDRWFLINIKGQAAGYVHAVCKVSGADAGPIKLEHEILTDWQDKKVRLKVQTYCEDNDYYFPVSASAEIREPGKDPATVTATVQKKVPYGNSQAKMQVVYRTGEKEYNLDKNLSEHTVTDYALLDIVPRLPFKEGRVFEFDLFIVEKLQAQRSHKIDYRGLEKVSINGTEKMLHKFEQKGSGIKNVKYWVDDDKQLVRVLKDDKEELLLTTQAEAEKRRTNL